ncbi:MAG: extradiol ring-cleavage dioxygenase [Proteobacteria bacterium]|nr:extradiol ring-cleavage dioxygenase [Pseudomonadota bacterium]
MADILGLGLSHFGGFMFPDEDMASRIRARLDDGSLPAMLDHPSKWPEAMREEWGSDDGTSFAKQHKAQYFDGLDRVRAALDAFKPDAVIIFGDDQYECFREDLVPPYCVFVADEFRCKPYFRARLFGADQRNIWDDPFETVFTHRGAPEIAGHLLRALMEREFDPAYSYKLPHQEFLGHAFANTLLYLDHRRTGFPYPVIPVAINAYGADLIRSKGGYVPQDNPPGSPGWLPDPPAPSPKRCFDLGIAIGEILKASPWRVALIGSASFSHGFLTEKNQYFYPDIASDRARHAELAAGNYAPWRELSIETLQEAGQHELLNWYPLAGAMHALGQPPIYCELLESHLMNSSKCIAVMPPG